jgi:diguanylate cyclase (GGDEF)-like protein/PAS domain S-box-containing protein
VPRLCPFAHVTTSHAVSAIEQMPRPRPASVSDVPKTEDVRIRARDAPLPPSEGLFRQLATHIPEALWVRDLDRSAIRYVNPAWETITGRKLVAGDPFDRCFDAVHPDDVAAVIRKAAARPSGGLDLECRILRPDGAVRWVHVRTFAMFDGAGAGYGVAGLMQDVTERKSANEKLLHLAYYDALTGLPNRTLLYESLGRALDQARAHKWAVSLLFIDIDGFKAVNDTFGHTVGDELLKQVAGRLLSCVRIRDMVGRIGGDEFALFLVTGTAQAAARVAQKVLATLRQPYSIKHHKVRTTASIGVASDQAHLMSAESLIESADRAMYRAKAAGRDSYSLSGPVLSVADERPAGGGRRGTGAKHDVDLMRPTVVDEGNSPRVNRPTVE